MMSGAGSNAVLRIPPPRRRPKSMHGLKIEHHDKAGVFPIRKSYRLAQSSPVRSIDAEP